MSEWQILGFEMLRPADALYLISAPLAFVIGVAALVARRRARRAFVDARHDSKFLPGFSANRARARVVLVSGAFLFLALSLLGPVRGFTWVDTRSKTLDLVVCIDTSRSMLVEDMKPNRLSRAKREVVALLDHLKGDRIALVGFSGDVRDVAPLTRDRQTLRFFLESMSPSDNQLGGTDIGGALERALEIFDGRTGASEAIILLTDGEDLEDRGLEVAALAKQRGIRVFVVGMGTLGGGKIPDGRGAFIRDDIGEEVVSSLAGVTLENLAEQTGGAYLSAEHNALPLEYIYEHRLSSIEGRTENGGKERIPHDRYQWPLALGLICMLSGAGLRERRPQVPAREDAGSTS